MLMLKALDLVMEEAFEIEEILAEVWWFPWRGVCFVTTSGYLQSGPQPRVPAIPRDS